MTTITAITRLCLLAALASLLFVTAGCGGSDGADGDATLPTVTTRQQGAFLLTLSTPRTAYAPGETVPFTLTVTNTGAEAVTLYYSSSHEAVEQVQSGGVEIWQPSGEAPVGAHETAYAPGQSHALDFSWNQTTPAERGLKQVPPGEYTLNAVLRVADSPEDQLYQQLPAAPLTIRIRQ